MAGKSMRPATNQIGFEIQRFDGLRVGWVGISEPLSKTEVDAKLKTMARIAGAEYRVYPALTETK